MPATTASMVRVLPPSASVPPSWPVICSIYSSESEFVSRLQMLRWGRRPRCPYCNSLANTPIKNSNRHHCNSCHTSFSVFVKTVMHGTRLDARKWALVSVMLYTVDNLPPLQDFATILQVNPNTASRIRRCLRFLDNDSLTLFQSIYETVVRDSQEQRTT